MYSSGTTGAPKCIVHGHGGTLLNHLKEHRLQSNMKDGDILFYYTGKKKKICGFMKGRNWIFLSCVLDDVELGEKLFLYFNG